MAITISQLTHSTKPKDIFEPPFATLHYFVSEHIAGENISYRSIAVSTDETKGFVDIKALKEHFEKKARNFAMCAFSTQRKIGENRGFKNEWDRILNAQTREGADNPKKGASIARKKHVERPIRLLYLKIRLFGQIFEILMKR